MTQLSKVIAIDGPSGSGKSTVAQIVAKNLSYQYIDTGAMFRAIAAAISDQGIDCDDESAVGEALKGISLNYSHNGEELNISVNGDDFTQRIRNHEVSALASLVSKYAAVRTYLLNFQRELAGKAFSVLEGRDIGTVVFPDAFAKFYLTASIDERAKRRCGQLGEKGEQVEISKVTEDLAKRDEQDMNREMAPLKAAEDAILVDSTGLNIQEVVGLICEKAKERSSLVN